MVSFASSSVACACESFPDSCLLFLILFVFVFVNDAYTFLISYLILSTYILTFILLCLTKKDWDNLLFCRGECEDVDSWFLVIEVSLPVKQGRLAFDDGTAVTVGLGA